MAKRNRRPDKGRPASDSQRRVFVDALGGIEDEWDRLVAQRIDGDVEAAAAGLRVSALAEQAIKQAHRGSAAYREAEQHDLRRLAESRPSGIRQGDAIAAAEFYVEWVRRRRALAWEGWDGRGPLDSAMDVLLTRSIRVMQEIVSLASQAHASAAFGRWRTLHEVGVIVTVLDRVGDGSLPPVHEDFRAQPRKAAEWMADMLLLHGAHQAIEEAQLIQRFLLEAFRDTSARRPLDRKHLATARTPALEEAEAHLQNLLSGRELDSNQQLFMRDRMWAKPLFRAKQTANGGRTMTDITRRLVTGLTREQLESGLDGAARASTDEPGLAGKPLASGDPIAIGATILYGAACNDVHASGQAGSASLDRFESVFTVDQILGIALSTFGVTAARALWWISCERGCSREVGIAEVQLDVELMRLARDFPYPDGADRSG